MVCAYAFLRCWYPTVDRGLSSSYRNNYVPLLNFYICFSQYTLSLTPEAILTHHLRVAMEYELMPVLLFKQIISANVDMSAQRHKSSPQKAFIPPVHSTQKRRMLLLILGIRSP